jgi:hypothetical protein
MAASGDGTLSAFRHPRPGEELDWLAIDVHGHIGLFSTGGRGPVPKTVAAHLDAVASAVEQLNAMAVTGECADQPAGPGNFSFWVEASRRGIYGFDWGPVMEGSFAQVTTPTRPVTIGATANRAVEEAALLVKLPVAFEEARNLYVDALGVALFGVDEEGTLRDG